VRGRIEKLLDAAKADGHRSGENPARLRGHLDHLLPRRPKLQRGHHPAMAWKVVPHFITQLRAMDSVGAFCLEFTILTAARAGEARGATWAEFDLIAKTWIVPAVRMKAGYEHRVPLTDRTVAILAKLAPVRGAGDFVFPGQKVAKPLSEMTLEAVLRRLKVKPVTTHGFRSSFKDWASEATSFPNELSEAALAHITGSKVERAYQRGDRLERRRELMEAWAQFCEGYRPL
jgi:integrase